MEENKVNMKKRKIVCKECNTTNSAKRAYCYMCGNELGTNSEVKYEEILLESELNKNRTYKKIWNIISILVVLSILIAGVFLLQKGLSYEIPSREFSMYKIEEYVGGDAYNGIIEASIRGSEIAGATMAKSIYICSGIVTMSVALSSTIVIRKLKCNR